MRMRSELRLCKFSTSSRQKSKNIPQSIGWRPWRIWQRTVNRGNFASFCQGRTNERMLFCINYCRVLFISRLLKVHSQFTRNIHVSYRILQHGEKGGIYRDSSCCLILYAEAMMTHVKTSNRLSTWRGRQGLSVRSNRTITQRSVSCSSMLTNLSRLLSIYSWPALFNGPS